MEQDYSFLANSSKGLFILNLFKQYKTAFYTTYPIKPR